MKLYDLVWVQHELYGHVGEILSLETPDKTFMVRMVPGEPGTLKEMDTSKLRALETRITAIQYVVVQGHGAFPIDMLRYENAAPYNFDPETLALDRSFGYDAYIVARAVQHRYKPWTRERWKSFGWELFEPYPPETWRSER